VIFKKKGALQLSINAIVVLILAITVLGLALTFITNMFAKTTDQLGEMDKQRSTQLINGLLDSNKKLTFEDPVLNVKSGTQTDFYFAISNTASASRAFYIQFKCDTAKNDNCAHEDIDGFWNFFKTQKCVVIEGNTPEAFRTTILPQGSRNEYMGKLIVYRNQIDDSSCESNFVNVADGFENIAVDTDFEKYDDVDIYVNVEQ
jgi:hypothetical protein